jgi:hypothetical protein
LEGYFFSPPDFCSATKSRLLAGNRGNHFLTIARFHSELRPAAGRPMQWARRAYHFRLLVRVPERPAGFDVALEQAMAMMDRAVGPVRMKVLRSQFRVWERWGGEAGIEEWRRRMLARMFCLRRQAVQSGFADIHAAVGQGCQLADLAGRSRAKRF